MERVIDSVNHPTHYQKEGRKECIVEMEEKFGPLAVYWFSVLSAYKYRYREGDKPGNSAEQDEAKAEWYDVKSGEMLEKCAEPGRECYAGCRRIANYYGAPHQCMKAVEEMSELSVELMKMVNGEGGDLDRVFEEIADASIMLQQLRLLLDPYQYTIDTIIERKIQRQLARIDAEEREGAS